MLISPTEIAHMIIVTLALGFIFMGFLKKPKTELDVLDYKHGFDWESFKYAALITAPGIILHELAHKFVAISFGLVAVFKVWWFGLFLGVFLKLINSPFILFAPGFVETGTRDAMQSMFISVAGPLMNLLLFGIAWYCLEYVKLSRRWAIILYLTKQINLFLFIFNMLPIPPLDGFKFFSSLIEIIF
ncbi:MAG: site-2 protease family protein [archaeon]|nr:site-2 protease family protein [archaeon]